MTATLLLSGLCCVAVPLLARTQVALVAPGEVLWYLSPRRGTVVSFCGEPGEPAWPGHRACGSRRRDCGTPRLARRLRLHLPPAASTAQAGPFGLRGVWCAIALMGAFQGPMFPTSSVFLSKWMPGKDAPGGDEKAWGTPR